MVSVDVKHLVDLLKVSVDVKHHVDLLTGHCHWLRGVSETHYGVGLYLKAKTTTTTTKRRKRERANFTESRAQPAGHGKIMKEPKNWHLSL